MRYLYGLDWTEQCFTYLQVKRPNQQYENTEGAQTVRSEVV